MAGEETQDLVQDYLDEDPSILSNEQLMAIAKAYGLTLAQMKSIAKTMSRTRKQLREQEGEGI